MSQPRHQLQPEDLGSVSVWRKAHTLTVGTGSYTRWMRLVRMAKYGSYAAAAVISYFSPSILVVGAFSPHWEPFSYVWSTVLLLGALASFAGVATKTWVGEYIGLWGIVAALSMYSFTAFTVEVTGNRIVLGFLALGFTMSAVARRQDVAMSKRIAEYRQRRDHGRQGL